MLFGKRTAAAVCSVVFSFLVSPVFATGIGSTENRYERDGASYESEAAKPQLQSRQETRAERRAGRRARVTRLSNPRAEKDAGATMGSYSFAPAADASVAERSSAAMSAFAAFSTSSPLVAEARRYMGTNPTKRRSLWCGTFMNMVLERTGRPRSKSDLAKSFAGYGTRIAGPQVGAIAVMSRGRNGGHVGIVTGVDANGNPIIISGNHENRVAEVAYPRARVLAYVMPDGSGPAAKRTQQARAGSVSAETREN